MDGKPLPAGAGGVPGPVAGAAEFSGALQVVARQFVCVIPGDIDFTRHRVAGFGVLVLDAHLQRLPAISVPIAFDVAMVNRKRPAMPAALCIPDLKAAVLRAMLDKSTFGLTLTLPARQRYLPTTFNKAILSTNCNTKLLTIAQHYNQCVLVYSHG